MKCKNCGGNYAARDLACPYCGTENPVGRLWKRQNDQAQQDYYTASAEELPVVRRQMANKVLNRVLLVEGILFALFVIGIFAAFFITEALSLSYTATHRESLETEMADLYEQEQFGELYVLLDEHDLFGEDYYEYSQMALLHYDYTQFCYARMSFMSETAAGEPDDYTLERLVDSMHDIFYSYIPAYPDITQANAAHLEAYQQDAAAFAAAMLGLEEEQMSLLAQDYLTLDEEDSLITFILERRYWDAE